MLKFNASVFNSSMSFRQVCQGQKTNIGERKKMRSRLQNFCTSLMFVFSTRVVRFGDVLAAPDICVCFQKCFPKPHEKQTCILQLVLVLVIAWQHTFSCYFIGMLLRGH